MYLRVHKNTIRITCPPRTSDTTISRFIESLEDAICMKLPKAPSDILFLWGHPYQVVYNNIPAVTIKDDQILVKNERQLEAFLKDIFYKMAIEIVTEYKTRLPSEVGLITLKVAKMRSRFGTCYKHRRLIRLNTHLVHMDPIFLTSVVVHEMAHLIEANHSSAFYKIVYDMLPDYETISKKLKQTFNSYIYIPKETR